MSAQVHQLPTKYSHQPIVQPDRGEWGALRAELHERCNDQDLAALWSEMNGAERRAVLASARLTASAALTSIEAMPQPSRDAIRSAIHRMSSYGQRLRDRLKTAEPTSCQLARNARQALLDKDLQAALHWLNLIEQGVA